MRKFIVAATAGLALLGGCSVTTSKTADPPPVGVSAAPAVATPTPVPSASSEPSQGTTDLPLGQSITVTGTTPDDSGNDHPFTIKVVANAQIKVNRGSLNNYTSAPTNGRYLGVQVVYSCTAGKCSYNEFDWTLRSKAGDEYRTTSDYEPILQSGNIPVGKNARGWLTFDVPAGTYTLEYVSNIVDTNPASWVVTVK